MPSRLQPSPGRARAGAFTLVEVLTVVAIVGVLVALALPALSKMQKTGRAVKCLSNLRQVGTAVRLYAGEHNGWFLPSDYSGASGNWYQLYWPYLYSTPPASQVLFSGYALPAVLHGTVLECPQAAHDPQELRRTFTALRSYGFNILLGNMQVGTATPSASWNGLAFQQFSKPASAALIADNFNSSYLSQQTLGGRHRGLANVLFLDGHVDAVDPAAHLSDRLKDPFWGIWAQYGGTQ